MKKHILKLLLTLISITLFYSGTAMAAEIVASGTCGADGDNVIWELDNKGILKISGTGSIDDYSYFQSAPWYTQKTAIDTILIIDGVDRIGDNNFNGCTNVTNVIIPNSIKSIGNYAFVSCSNLTNVIIPDSVIDIESGAFEHCDSLNNIIVSNNNTNYCSQNGVLFNKDRTQLINYPAGKPETIYSIPSSVTIIGASAFAYCTNLTSIRIPPSVINIGGYAFNRCNSLESIIIPGSVKNIESATFYCCTGLKNVIIMNGVTSIGDYAFFNCSGIRSLAIPDSITSIGESAFSDCSSLSSITIPERVSSIGDFAFQSCMSLVSITFPNNLISIGIQAFYNCTSLTSVTIPSSVTDISYNAFIASGVEKLFMPGINEISIGENAFADTHPTVYCYEYTPNEGWARSKGFSVVLLDNLSPDDFVTLALPEVDSVGIGFKKRLEVGLFPQLPEYKAEWFSSNLSIVSVDEDGMLTGISAGTATVTLSYGGVQASCQITVLRPEEYITITIPENVIVGIDKQAYLESSVSPWMEEVEQKWTSLNPDVVTISADGTLTGVNAGTADVTLSYGGVQAVCHVTVVQYAENFSLTELWLVAKTGMDASSLVTDIEPADSVVQFVWSTENSIYATVDDNGYVTAGAVGETTLTVTDELSGLSRTVAVHSCYPVTAIDLTLSENTVYLGTSAQATASVTMRTQNCENHLVTFSSSNSSIAAINQQGNIQTFHPGTVTITAAAVDNESIIASATLSVTKDFHYILTLPVHLTEIGSEAFSGLPEAEAVRIPESVTSIADDAFSCSNVIILAPDGSYAITWAQDHGFDYLIE